MLSLGGYLVGVAELAVVIGALGFAAHRLRVRLIPSWSGAPAYLVEVIAVVGLLTWVCEALGVVNLLRDAPLIIASLLVAAATWRFAPPREEDPAVRGPEAPPVPALALLVTLGLVTLLFIHWGFEAKRSLDGGMGNFDSIWYHMPFAADMAQSGSVTGIHYTDTVFLNWLYPQNSELLHAAGIVLTGRDTVSLFLNFLWLAVTLLSAWCIGRPYARGHLTVAAAAIILESHTLVVREPGQAKNDVAAAALLLAAVAIFITARSAWRASRDAAAERKDAASPESDGGVIGWPLAVAGLAAGLAAGTKVTVLAGVAALSLAAIALGPPGRRRAASAWWFLPLLAGGGYWYARNLVIAANPIPQVRSIGPIGLPGPDRLQSGRPDFTILHYLTDNDIWRDYFFPGAHLAFGDLWQVVFLASVVGAVVAIAWGRDRVIRWMGLVALVGLIAYPATPLSAAGLEGDPDAFAINIRFVVPALISGLVLLPLAKVFDRSWRQWALLAGFLLLLLLTDRPDGALRVPERGFGILVALIAVVIPAGLLFASRRGGSRNAVIAGWAVLGLAVVAIGHGVENNYIEDRFVSYDVTERAGDLKPAYRWAKDQEDQRIGLAGTTAGFLEYPFYGDDLSNRVRYLGQKGPKGAFYAIPTCSEFRAAVNAEDLDYLVTSPFLNFVGSEPIRSPEAKWLVGESAVEPILRNGMSAVWKVTGELDPEGCGPQNAPLRKVPQSPGT